MSIPTIEEDPVIASIVFSKASLRFNFFRLKSTKFAITSESVS